MKIRNYIIFDKKEGNFVPKHGNLILKNKTVLYPISNRNPFPHPIPQNFNYKILDYRSNITDSLGNIIKVRETYVIQEVEIFDGKENPLDWHEMYLIHKTWLNTQRLQLMFGEHWIQKENTIDKLSKIFAIIGVLAGLFFGYLNYKKGGEIKYLKIQQNLLQNNIHNLINFSDSLELVINKYSIQINELENLNNNDLSKASNDDKNSFDSENNSNKPLNIVPKENYPKSITPIKELNEVLYKKRVDSLLKYQNPSILKIENNIQEYLDKEIVIMDYIRIVNLYFGKYSGEKNNYYSFGFGKTWSLVYFKRSEFKDLFDYLEKHDSAPLKLKVKILSSKFDKSSIHPNYEGLSWEPIK